MLMLYILEGRGGTTVTRFVEKGCLEGVMLSFKPSIDTQRIVSVPYRIFTASDIADRAETLEQNRLRNTKGDFPVNRWDMSFNLSFCLSVSFGVGYLVNTTSYQGLARATSL